MVDNGEVMNEFLPVFKLPSRGCIAIEDGRSYVPAICVFRTPYTHSIHHVTALVSQPLARAEHMLRSLSPPCQC